ncbi:nicotinic acetylcholine receptor alpha4 subunit isoform X1 [Apis mellifera]|uniref:Nicotinic acetylcholine receptor alpha4 subunit n=2 Tax=Apis mellifera TaxID=7460 RepID=A0EIZ3_APIME|nr:nicotinic acetylcholine receptor alpha4 subunit precursor [Apis mellifera]XP_006562617.1 nicotinic acetylcholine receptor alpha4 subunit isoform X1 [Apis mellifera]XP_006562618.1 nicotinic acetylcholine receptor alpha4 subunit isoform X1 [Apis mellifera]XP_016768429.1 nicotinic acetylcholine receptor alpha4 subunit isoform X1 [Apis mellifera]XP_016768430.1 nicotinic acetylcholine receptor alpha4 subunit isoform X1 [Apis mellifera]AAY87892.1 nicotinic acetylcholine receptor alpha4 subunit [A|eukprot:NP_001091691.1 nicotinic acetylcholine receptor alpha4 subunit precursor [Apis mellifera]
MPPIIGETLRVWFLSALVVHGAVAGNPDAKRLYDDLLSNYNKLVRPVVNTSDVLRVCIKLKLSQLIDVNLKNQIMTTNLWVEQSWYDYKLRWEPKEYGGVKMLHVPSDHIWRPDIVLYNNADGNFEVTLATKATIYHQGLVEWKPPAIYKSSCEIDVEYFPFDEQTCVLKFGSWTYDGFKVDLRHMDEKSGSNVVDVGVDLSEFYMSVEWDILEVPAVRNEKFYTCCDEPYLDITFNITMRRKTLFYTVNIIIPCMGISFLTVLTFYLPSDSGEKVTLSISILISLHVFFLLVVEIIPPTSLVVPLLGKYLIFAMILVSISICVTVVVLNVHFRSPQTHKMAPWVKRVFIHILPRLLVMRRPQYKFETNRYSSGRVLMRTVRGKEKTCYYPYHPSTQEDSEEHLTPKRFHSRAASKEDLSPSSLADGARFGGSCLIHGPPLPPLPLHTECEDLSVSGEAGIEEVKSPVLRSPPAFSHSRCPPEIHKSCICVRFIAEHTKMLEDSTKVKEDWKYVAMVLDRLFLWIFTLAVLVGTAGIILQAPTLYDDRVPIDKKFNEFGTTAVVNCPPQ